MSKPRHHPRTASQVKLRLRLPTDGSVDLDKLRAALEARLEKPPAPEPEVKVVPVPARPKVAPLPKPQPKSSGVWQWINNNAPTAVSIFSAVLAFFFGLIYIGQKSTGGNVWPLLVWAFFASIGIFAISFAVIVFRQLNLEDSAASKHWVEIKEDPKKAYVPALIFAGVTVAVLFGLALFQSPPTEVAQGKGKSETETPVKPTKDPTGEPKSPLVIPPTPPSKTKEIDTPKPTVPEAIPLKPAEGYVGRLGTVCGVFGLMGLGLFKLNRMKKARFPDAEALRAGAKNEYIEFARGFRTFLAVQGGGLLVAAAVGAAILVWDTTGWEFEVEGRPDLSQAYSVWSLIPWMIMGMALAAPMVMALGAAGLDLMPTLDRKFNPSKEGSAVKRFLQRKLWHIVLSGLVFGAFVSVIKVEPVQYWLHLWLKWTFVFGLITGFVWTRKNGKGKEKVKRPPSTRPVEFSSMVWFNLPLLMVFAALLAVGGVLLAGTTWLHLWWLTPIAFIVATMLVAASRHLPRLITIWWWIVVVPAVVAALCDWMIWDETFWMIFWVLVGAGIVLEQLNNTDGEWSSHCLLVLPESKGDYRPVIQPDRSGVQVRWASLLGIMLVLLVLLISSGFFVWNGL